MITFEEIVKVKLDGRLVGEIRKVEGGYQYFPKSKKQGGQIFRNLETCKRSLY